MLFTDPPVNQEVLDEICRLSLEISRRIASKTADEEEGKLSGFATLTREFSFAPRKLHIGLDKKSEVVLHRSIGKTEEKCDSWFLIVHKNYIHVYVMYRYMVLHMNWIASV